MTSAFERADGGIDYEGVIMAGICAPRARDATSVLVYLENYRHLVERVEPALFRPENNALFMAMRVFMEDTGGGLLDEHALLDILISERAGPDVQVKYTELFARYAGQEVTQADYRYAVTRFIKFHEERLFEQALKDSFTIKSQGMKVGKEYLQGIGPARQFLSEQLANIESSVSKNVVPEGDLRHETEEVWLEYQARKTEPASTLGVLSGIPPLDELTMGAQNGELCFICGYTESGKSFCVLNWADNACRKQFKNVAIGTAEVTRKQYRMRHSVLLARDSQFGLPQGIDSEAFKRGKLSPQEEEGLQKALDDFKRNKSYGQFYLFQIPFGSDFSWIANKANSIHALWHDIGGLDALFIDSLNLVVPFGKGDAKRHFMNDTIRRAKQFAVDFDNGRGIPIITPWHANRTSYAKACEEGHYALNSWQEADELERSADLLFWLLRLPNQPNSHEILAGVEKNRSGKGHVIFPLYEDFASSYLGAVSSGAPIMTGGSTPPSSAGSVFVDRAAGLY